MDETDRPAFVSAADVHRAWRETATEAMQLALSVLRGDAYRGGDPAGLEVSQARGEAIDALGMALGHTAILPPTPPFVVGAAEVGQQRRSPRVDPTRLELIEATLNRHGARLLHLEELAGVEPPF